MGLLNKSDWKAQWVSRPDPEQQADRKAGVKWIWVAGEDAIKHVSPGKRFFRYNLDLPTSPQKATLLVSGRNSMEAFVNGTKVGLSSTWGTFEVLDIEHALKTGSNDISVTVTTDGTGGMAALLKLTQANGSIRRIPSDEKWQASTSQDSGFAAAAVIADLGAKPIADPWPPQPASYFQTAFTAKKNVNRARLYVTSLGSYIAFLNGHRVGKDVLIPGWTDYSKRIQYQSYDVTGLVNDGSNVIGAVVGDGWYASGLGWKLQRFLFGPPPRRLLLQLELTSSNKENARSLKPAKLRSITAARFCSKMYASKMYNSWNRGLL